MGTDIHAYLEVQIDGRWVCHSQPRIKRNYELFGRIAGIGGAAPIIEPRGLPSDISEITRIEYEHDGADAHTPGWLSRSEMEQIADLAPDLSGLGLFGYVTGNPPWGIPGDGHPAQYQDARLIFWFDN
jgi:hypothetical protein